MVFQLCKLSRSLAENKCTRFNVKRSKFNKRRHSASGLCSKYTRESAEDFRTSVDFSSILCTFENTFNSYQDPIRICLKTLNFLSPVSFSLRRGSILFSFSPPKKYHGTKADIDITLLFRQFFREKGKPRSRKGWGRRGRLRDRGRRYLPIDREGRRDGGEK